MTADPRFHPSAGPHALDAVAAAAGATHRGDGARLLRGVAPLQEAGPDELSFLDNPRYADALGRTRAGAVVLRPAMAARLPAGTVGLETADPYLGFALAARLFHPPAAAVPGRHPTAVVAPDAAVGEGCELGPYAVVEAGAVLGPGCVLGAHAVVGPGVVLGARCRLHPHATVSYAVLGDDVVLHPGARVGQEGFGFAVTREGGFVTMPQLGRVLLGDGVEIGANSAVDRGSGHDTVLGPGTRLDNLVQIGHNVRVGRGCVIVALAGISGSTTLGDHVTLAAQAGIAGHLTIGDRARIGAQSGVMNDVPAGSDVVGSPAWPVREFMRAMVHLKRLGQARKAD